MSLRPLASAPNHIPPFSTRSSRVLPLRTGSKSNGTPPEGTETRNPRIPSNSTLLKITRTRADWSRRTLQDASTDIACLSSRKQTFVLATESACTTSAVQPDVFQNAIVPSEKTRNAFPMQSQQTRLSASFSHMATKARVIRQGQGIRLRAHSLPVACPNLEHSRTRNFSHERKGLLSVTLTAGSAHISSHNSRMDAKSENVSTIVTDQNFPIPYQPLQKKDEQEHAVQGNYDKAKKATAYVKTLNANARKLMYLQ